MYSRCVQQRASFTKVDDDIICTEKIIADRKTFFIDLKSNSRGRVVRITAAILDCSEEEATALLERNDWNIRKAVAAAGK